MVLGTSRGFYVNELLLRRRLIFVAENPHHYKDSPCTYIGGGLGGLLVVFIEGLQSVDMVPQMKFGALKERLVSRSGSS